MHDIVKDHYGKALQSSEDLRTTACERHYGLFDSCGSPVPFDRENTAGAEGACC